MFKTTYTVQMPQGTMLFKITVKCRQLNKDDDVFNFNINQVCHDWWQNEKSQEFKTTPHALCLGLWLFLSEKIKEDSNYQARDVIVDNIKLDAPGLNISFGVDSH